MLGKTKESKNNKIPSNKKKKGLFSKKESKKNTKKLEKIEEKSTKKTIDNSLNSSASEKNIKVFSENLNKEKIVGTSSKNLNESKINKTSSKILNEGKLTKTSSNEEKNLATKKEGLNLSSKKKLKKPSTADSIKKYIKKTPISIVEYYDLPYRYNKTVVKLLSQTPSTLFVYWDISDEDRLNFEKKYGKTFFQDTKPVLIIHNDTLRYSFEIEINDFANCWYLHVNDSKCDYRIELGRRPIVKKDKLEHTDYIYITSSNELEVPNDKILFNNKETVYFENVKTGKVTGRNISTFSFTKSMEKIYNVYDLYKKIYNEENVELIYDMSNPSSHPSSSF